MFSDPQSITVNSVAQSMPRVKSDGSSSEYISADGNFRLTISHQNSRGRIRSLVKVVQRKIVTNPLDSTNDYDTITYQMVIEHPEYGFSATEIGYLVTGVTAWINTAGVVGKLFGQES